MSGIVERVGILERVGTPESVGILESVRIPENYKDPFNEYDMCRDIVDLPKCKHQSVLIIRIPTHSGILAVSGISKPSGTRPDPEKNSRPDPTRHFRVLAHL